MKNLLKIKKYRKTKRVLYRRYIVCMIGVLILSVAMGMLVKLNLGAEANATVYTCLSRMFNLSVGSISLFANCVFLIMAFYVDKTKIGLSTFLFLILNKWPVDWIINYFPEFESIWIRCFMVILAVGVTALGSDLLICANTGLTALDAFNVGVSERYNIPYSHVRWSLDGLLLIIAMLLHGKIGIGTLLCFVMIGKCLEFWRKLVEPKVKYWIYEDH